MIPVIIDLTARATGFTAAEIVGYSRTRDLVRARHNAIRLAARNGATIASIARSFHRDPSTIRHAIRTAGRAEA